jgi:hypothetical protein
MDDPRSNARRSRRQVRQTLAQYFFLISGAIAIVSSLITMFVVLWLAFHPTSSVAYVISKGSTGDGGHNNVARDHYTLNASSVIIPRSEQTPFPGVVGEIIEQYKQKEAIADSLGRPSIAPRPGAEGVPLSDLTKGASAAFASLGMEVTAVPLPLDSQFNEPTSTQPKSTTKSPAAKQTSSPAVTVAAVTPAASHVATSSMTSTENDLDYYDDYYDDEYAYYEEDDYFYENVEVTITPTNTLRHRQVTMTSGSTITTTVEYVAVELQKMTRLRTHIVGE